jgi:allophanate hydrolase subunit 2
MGVRLAGNICKAIKSHNIPSEGIIKGSIQVPGDGNPIILMNDHPTMGGYPKIAIVILTDLSKIAQLPIGSQINFKQITLKEAEILYKDKIFNFNKQIKNIKIR